MAKGRLIARVYGPKRRCENCKHFDLQQGQADLDQFPAFRAAAAVISPDSMGRIVAASSEDKPADKTLDKPTWLTTTRVGRFLKKIHKFFFGVSAPKRGTGARWQEIGACTLHNYGCWQGGKCEDWS